MNDPDGRRYQRIDTNHIVEVSERRVPPGMAQTYKARLKDISYGGIFLETPSPPDVGTIIEITVQVGESQALLKGMVAWSEPDRGAGIELTGVTADTKDALRGLMRDLQQQ